VAFRAVCRISTASQRISCISEAARQGDPISHTRALGGLLTGLAIGGVALLGTGGLAVAVVGAAASIGVTVSTGVAASVAVVATIGATTSIFAGLGELIGSLSWSNHDAGHILEGSPNVFINGRPAARASLSTITCDKHGFQLVAEGSSNVYINGIPAARVGNRTTCDGKISAGSPNVFIGGGTTQTENIAPEVPDWLHRAMLAIGLGSAAVLTGPIAVVLGLVGGKVVGDFSHSKGGEWFGEGSDGQKITAFGGAVLGGAALGGGVGRVRDGLMHAIKSKWRDWAVILGMLRLLENLIVSQMSLDCAPSQIAKQLLTGMLLKNMLSKKLNIKVLE